MKKLINRIRTFFDLRPYIPYEEGTTMWMNGEAIYEYINGEWVKI